MSSRRRKDRWHQRIARDPWVDMADRVRRSELPPTAKVMADALEERHRSRGMARVRIGYGGRTEYTDEFGRVHRCKPGLAEATGHSRRSMIRGRELLVAHGFLVYMPGGGPQHKSCGRGGRGKAQARTAADRPFIVRFIGNGGRTPGGEGLANEYMPAGAPGTEQVEVLAPEEPSRPAVPRRSLAQVLEEHRARGP